jgi:hypothetical protein
VGFEADGPFVVGANLPWVGYGTDYGASAWFPEGGLASRPDARAVLEDACATVARDGLRIMRVFVVCDARSGVTFDAGLPAALDFAFFRDMDVLLETAGRHGVGVIPVLFDFHLCHPPRIANGVQTGGRADLITGTRARTALLDRIVGPIVDRYRDHHAIAAWDVMNEPEWCVNPPWRFWDRSVPPDAMRHFLSEAVAAVRAVTAQPVTVGCATVSGLDAVRALRLDFYQVHWYEKFGWDALRRPVSDLALDGPVVLGEFPGMPRRRPVAAMLEAARLAGYRGALVWSVLSDDDQSAYPEDVSTWARHGHASPDRSGRS